MTGVTKAWTIHAGEGDPAKADPAALVHDDLPLAEPGPGEVLVEPLYGSWESNMTHALTRRPIDICRARKERRVVLGNSGVGRVLKGGPGTTLREGTVCLYALPHEFDAFGYPTRLMGFDLPGVRGILARRGVWKETALVPLPEGTRHSLRQWAAFGVRYLTAWSSWKIALGTWRLQMGEADQAVPHVWGWGGGTSLASVQLARHFGARAALLSGKPERLAQIASLGIDAVDRRPFQDLAHDPAREAADAGYAERYRGAERVFLETVRSRTEGAGVSIFFDYIGAPVIQATSRALARQGVIATAGWLEGVEIRLVRAAECIKRHTHVHTHGYRKDDVVPAVRFAEEHGWLPPIAADERVWGWDEMPALARAFAGGAISTYFPIYQVNPE